MRPTVADPLQTPGSRQMIHLDRKSGSLSPMSFVPNRRPNGKRCSLGDSWNLTDATADDSNHRMTIVPSCGPTNSRRAQNSPRNLIGRRQIDCHHTKIRSKCAKAISVAPNCSAQRNCPRSLDDPASCPNPPNGSRRSSNSRVARSPAKNPRATFHPFHASRHHNARRDSPCRCVETIRHQNGNSRRGTCRRHEGSLRGSRRLHETSRRVTCRLQSVRPHASAHRPPNDHRHASRDFHAKTLHVHHH